MCKGAVAMLTVPSRIEPDPGELDDWCRRHLAAGVRSVLFRDGWLSTVIGLELTTGRAVVVKIREAAERLLGCWVVHERLFAAGFPCPEPLVDPRPLGGGVATAEAFVDGGEPMPTTGRAARPFADALALLITMGPEPGDVPSVDPPPSWTNWHHPGFGVWPWPEDIRVDLNTVTGPKWLEDTAVAVRERLTRSSRPGVVITHGDWYSGNLRWRGTSLHVAHDWDSIIAADEPVAVGLAASVYPATRGGTEATVDETAAFIDAYASARGCTFAVDELERCWAAGLWNRCVDAKKQLARDGGTRSLHEGEAGERRRRAGL